MIYPGTYITAKESTIKYPAPKDLIKMDVLELIEIDPDHKDIPRLREYYREVLENTLNDHFAGTACELDEEASFNINKVAQQMVKRFVDEGRMHTRVLDRKAAYLTCDYGMGLADWIIEYLGGFDRILVS